MTTAFLLTYWIERVGNIHTIISDLRKGTVVPDRIVVFSNNPVITMEKLSSTLKIEWINSGKNLGHRVRFVAALTQPTDNYLFIDDDITVGPKTLENYLKYREDETCLGMWGKKINNRIPGHFYTGAQEFASHRIKQPQDVDLLIGRGTMFCPFKTLVNMFNLEKELIGSPEYNEGREADIILSMANKSKVIPADKESMFIGLNEGGVGYVRQPGHFNKRSLITEKIYAIQQR
jgi:hypothetical protein